MKFCKTTIGESMGLSQKEQAKSLGVSQSLISYRKKNNNKSRAKHLKELDRIIMTMPADELDAFSKEIMRILESYK